MKKWQLPVLFPFEQLLYSQVSTCSLENFSVPRKLGDEGTIFQSSKEVQPWGGASWPLAYCFVSGVPQSFGGVVTLS